MYADFLTDTMVERPVDKWYYFKSAFSDEEIKRVHTIFEYVAMKDATITNDGEVFKDYRTSQVAWGEYNDNTEWLYKKAGRLGNAANQSMWNMDLMGMSEGFQYTIYNGDEKAHYDWHMDIGSGRMSRRKLSIVVQLTDPQEYEGGELEFLRGRTVDADIPKDKGDVVVFPSYFLHRVKPVTQGQRRSLVLWISGQPFK